MRRFLTTLFVLTLFVVLVLPALLVKGRYPGHGAGQGSPAEGTIAIQIFDDSTREMLEFPLEKYIEGVVAAEMPASFHLEALKAQALVARTYAVKRMRIFGGTGCATQLQADLCTDPSTGQAWLGEGQLRERWGYFDYFFNARRIRAAVESTAGLIVAYHGEPIDALYHSTSGGKTEAAQFVWGQPVPYLVSVDSPGEEKAPRFSETRLFTLTELAARLAVPPGDLQDLVQRGGLPMEVLGKSPTGRATQVRVGSLSLTGRDVREKLGINSTWFEAQAARGGIEITTRGFGHGVGMSQYGADAMARQGGSYQEIIAHYYPGTEIVPIFRE